MAELARPKLPRNLAIIVGFLCLASFVLILLMAKGSDFGQSKVDEKRAAQQKEDEAKKLQAKIDNPQEATMAEYARAQAAIATAASTPAATPGNAASAPAVAQGMPAIPPVSQYDLERLDRAQKAIEQGRHNREADTDKGDGNGAQAANGSRSGNPGFVMYQAGSASGQQGGSPLTIASNQGGASTSNQAFDQQDPENDPRVQAEKRKLEQYARSAGAADTGSKSNGNGLDANGKWLFSAQNGAVKPSATIVAQQAKGLYWMAPGTAINAVLLNAVDTKLPGHLVARVTQNIYDSRYGRYLVIPAGSMLQGQYNSSIQDGQDRVLMVFDSLVTPAGGTVPLGNMSAGDALGRAGIEGDLHTHFFERLGIATLLALEAVGMDKLSPKQSSTSYGGTTTAPTTNGAQIIANTANQELQHRYAVAPNITIPEGAKMTIITTGAIEVPPIANTR